jgi:hypothetical protein
MRIWPIKLVSQMVSTISGNTQAQIQSSEQPQVKIAPFSLPINAASASRH